ncbi:JAB domain-containing protein [Pelosinus baikalensis]|uniref:JAB domain-containing protein n=1 Tax=Pelosinus baikalensis TaxID=2892015 RepID=A0ABS8HQN2_9FIRM|nr:JAB domain-containing protein [Pelosinus baikalensis]MCC5465385.1 JAB domain-containing protein [Pelosinus baikalensis]
MKHIQVVSTQMVKERNFKYEYKRITCPRDIYQILRDFIGTIDREVFVMATLDIKNNVNALHTVSIGSLNASIVHPRELFKVAILANAASIIIAHNHPSGDPAPSSEDLSLTQKLVEAGKLLDIPILDHIVVGDDERCYRKQHPCPCKIYDLPELSEEMPH